MRAVCFVAVVGRPCLLTPGIFPLVELSYFSYALLFSKYGGVDTFDLVDVQLYESWSRASESIDGHGMAPEDYLVAWATAVTTGGSWCWPAAR